MHLLLTLQLLLEIDFQLFDKKLLPAELITKTRFLTVTNRLLTLMC